MTKNLALLCALSLAAACGSHATKRGAINLGSQPTAITLVSGDNNDVDLTSSHISLGSIIRITPASGGSTLTGLVSAPFDDGDLFMLRNDSAVDSLTLANARTSVAANQFLLSSAGDVVLPPKSSVWLEMDKTATKWVQGPGHINSPTFNGTVSTTSAQIGIGQETVTSGALSLTKKSFLSTTGTVAYTLANGTVTGQRKIIECTVAASSPAGTLTITTPAGTEPATHVFSAVGQALELEWNGTGWHMIKKTRAGHRTLVVGTTLTAGMDMEYTYDLSVTGTVVSTTTKALPNGTVPGEECHIDVTTSAASASGTLGFTGMSALGVAVTQAAGIGNGATDKSFSLALKWSGAEWQIVFLGTNTGVTISMLEQFFQNFAANENASRDIAA